MRRRVAITGIGVICPLGRGVDEVWENVIAGRTAVEVASFRNRASGIELTVPAARLPPGSMDAPAKNIAGLVDRFTYMALQAANDAVAQARLSLDVYARERVGVCNGTCMGGITETENGFDAIFLKERPRVHPFTVIRTMYNAPSALIATALGLTGPVLGYSTTCSSSAVAIGEATRLIRHGYADAMIAGGSESLLTYSALICWHSAQLLAPIAKKPQESCRPFSADRNGTVLGEGAAFFVLEEWNLAMRRGAAILGEIVGYGCTSDSGHLTQPSVDGQARPMAAALGDAELQPEQICYIHAHGTGTKANDATESAAVKKVFGTHAYAIPVSSSKAQVGHMVGAAGAIGFMFSLMALQTGVVPPTINLEHPDPACDLDYVPFLGRTVPDLRYAMCNAFGFGGTAVSLIAGALQRRTGLQ